MPFAGAYRPPIGVATLAAILKERGERVRTLSLNVEFATGIGLDLYDSVIGAGKNSTRNLAYDAFFGEFVFSSFSDIHRDERAELYLEWIKSEGLVSDYDWARYVLYELYDRVPAFLEKTSRKILSYDPEFLGFSCIFQQSLPSLSLARWIKGQRQDITILFGGAAFAGAMGRELFLRHDVIDAACLGEGEESLPAFIDAWRSGAQRAVQGIAYRSKAGGLTEGPEAAPVRNLDRYPPPDYEDHFDGLPKEVLLKTRLQYEGSRGCWWGQKHHCTFCGQNAEGLSFREKSSEKVEQELRMLMSKHEVRLIEFCDNILSLRHQRELLPRLASRWPPPQLFFEVKANLCRHAVRDLAASGVGEIQPGIEALSDTQLKRMRKGITALQNIALLKWCRVYGVRPYWNILWGFPGESEAEYLWTMRVIPLITHLQPPQACGRLRIDRFSPFFMTPGEFGIARLTPYAGYFHLFPQHPPEVLERLAYHFEIGELKPGFDVGGDALIKAVDALCEKWRAVWRHDACLRAVRSKDGWAIIDRRTSTSPQKIHMSDAQMRLLAHLDRPRSTPSNHPVLASLVDKDLVLIDGSRTLSLVELTDEDFLYLTGETKGELEHV